MKKSMSKRLLTVFLSICLIASFSIPALAAGLIPQVSGAIGIIGTTSVSTETVEVSTDAVELTIDDITPYEDDYFYYEPEPEYTDSSTVINVNGKALEFDSVQPQDVTYEYITIVPLVPVMKALGGTVSYSPEDKTITAVYEDTTLSFSVGDNEAEVTKSGETGSIFIYPVFMDGTTFVDPAVFSDAFGLITTSSYAWNESISIYNLDLILSDYEDSFTVMDTYMQMALDLPAYSVDGTYSGFINAETPYIDFTFPAEGEFSTVAAGMNAAGNLSIATDAAKALELISEEEEEDALLLLSLLMKTNFEYIFNADAAELYIKCPLINNALSLDASDWILINFNDIGYDASSFDFSKMSFLDIMALSIKSQAGTYSAVDYDSAKALFDTMESFCGDDLFEVSEKDGETTYTLNLKTEDMLKIFYDLVGDFADDEEFQAVFEKLNLDLSLSFSTDGTYESSVVFDFFYGEEHSAFDISLTAKDKFPGKSEMELTISVSSISFGNIEGSLTYEAESKITDKDAVPTAPPSGENIVNINDINPW